MHAQCIRPTLFVKFKFVKYLLYPIREIRHLWENKRYMVCIHWWGYEWCVESESTLITGVLLCNVCGRGACMHVLMYTCMHLWAVSGAL